MNGWCDPQRQAPSDRAGWTDVDVGRFSNESAMPIQPHSPHHPDRESSHAVEAENLKPGDPPMPPTTPEGSEASSRSPKTRTDPNTGAPTPGRPDTAGG
jgi:hypothetical protein